LTFSLPFHFHYWFHFASFLHFFFVISLHYTFHFFDFRRFLHFISLRSSLSILFSLSYADILPLLIFIHYFIISLILFSL
jgi:hypothetical protein